MSKQTFYSQPIVFTSIMGALAFIISLITPNLPQVCQVYKTLTIKELGLYVCFDWSTSVFS